MMVFTGIVFNFPIPFRLPPSCLPLSLNWACFFPFITLLKLAPEVSYRVTFLFFFSSNSSQTSRSYSVIYFWGYFYSFCLLCYLYFLFFFYFAPCKGNKITLLYFLCCSYFSFPTSRFPFSLSQVTHSCCLVFFPFSFNLCSFSYIQVLSSLRSRRDWKRNSMALSGSSFSISLSPSSFFLFLPFSPCVTASQVMMGRRNCMSAEN